MGKIQYYSTCTVIPPHILRHVADHGDAAARDTIVATLHQSAEIAKRSHTPFAALRSRVNYARQRKVYTAEHRQTLPGRLLMSESSRANRDIEANEAFIGCGATYDFYAKVFLRNSIDDRGMPLLSSIHYGMKFDNAMWNGRQMIYGDGDGKLFRRFTAALDVIAHELTHGMTQHSAALLYQDQPGALNEHISDAFGIMVKQKQLGLSSAQSDWLIGVGLFARGVKGKAIRSMAAPGTAYDDPLLGKDPQPAHMRDFVNTTDDNGGVHINSGIPNHAFYLASIGLGGNAWDVAGRIWYDVLTTRLHPDAGFQAFADSTVASAGDLYGVGGEVQRIVAEAWTKVGIEAGAAVKKAASPRLYGVVHGQDKWRDRPLINRLNNRLISRLNRGK
jgi:Zn-dependent metalloprotease